MIMALWGRDRLAADSAVGDGGGWRGVTLAHNVASPAGVDAVPAEARAAGARRGEAGSSGAVRDLGTWRCGICCGASENPRCGRRSAGYQRAGWY
jgi:hypothetical protein